MDKKILKGLIDEKLELIREQFSIIKEYEGKIPVIELDIIMGNIRDLYELVLSLQMETIRGSMLEQAPVEKREPVADATSVKITAEPLAERPEPEPEPENEPEIPAQKEPEANSRFSSGIISMEPVKEEPVVERIKQAPPAYMRPVRFENEPVPVQPRFDPEPAPAPEPESVHPTNPVTTDQPAEEKPPQDKFQRTTFDLFSDSPQTTIADRLRESQDKRLADKLQENKIADLRSTIGINDKFLFINELFDGNMRIYDEIIQKLNGCTTHAQADLLMLDLKIAYNWDSESPTVKKFVELVRRKF